MTKSGTTEATALKYDDLSRATHKGPYNKNLQPSAKPAPRPAGPTAPLKGPDKGGV